jgi:alanyl aminopeptidase
VRQPIESNDDIANAFDDITYEKGSALLNMFESYMGVERFREGVRRYLAAHAWKNATSADFLASLAGSDARIAPAFSSFLDQPGVPLVTVALDCQNGEAKLDLTQQRFFPLGSQGGAAELWQAPVCVRYPAESDEARECALLDQPSSRMTLPKANSCPAWVQANAGADGYYRVLYQGNLLAELLKNDARALTLSEKVALIGDISALTGNGKIPLGQALALAPGLARDPNRQVVTKTMWVTTGLQDNLVPPSLLPQYHHFLEDLYGSRARALGWKDRPGESDDDRLLRPTLVSVIANQAEDPEFIARAKSLTMAWLDDRKAVDRDMLSTVIMTAARHGDSALFDRLRAAAKQEKDEQILNTLLYGLGSFPDPAIVQKALPIVLTDEFDSRQSLSIPFGVSGSPKTRDLAYDFVKQNWDALIAKLPTDSGAFLPYVGGGYCDAAHYQDVQAFFQGRSTKYTGGPRTLQQVLERINLCIAYKQAQAASVAEFLEKYKGSPGPGAGGGGY